MLHFPVFSPTEAFFLSHMSSSNQLCGYDVSQLVSEISGFSGSSAFIIFGDHHHVIFVDPRYTLQAKNECFASFEVIECGYLDVLEPHIHQWMTHHAFSILRYDPQNLSLAQYSSLRETFPQLQLIPFQIASETSSKTSIIPYPLIYSGETFQEKKIDFLNNWNAKNTKPFEENDALLITSPESIAWLFNLRAQKFHYTPTFPSLALLTINHAFLWTLPHDLSIEAAESLSSDVTIQSIENVEWISSLQSTLNAPKINFIWYDKNKISQAMYDALHQKHTLNLNPCNDPFETIRCVKNEIERKNFQTIHELEAIAVIKLFAWIHRSSIHALSEYHIAQQLEFYRQSCQKYKGPSFKTIVATGANAAIVHYSPSQTQSSVLQNGTLLLDVGGQYLGGTTDMTRTIWIGSEAPSCKIKEIYTAILKGHIALAQSVFPQGTTGSQLDTLARQFLWKAGYDYAHGTGHGVGNYLAVHEGPYNISPRNHIALQEGVIISNEPGFYKSNEFGIRLENLMEIRKIKQFSDSSDKDFLSFATLTLIPFDDQLIQWEFITQDEEEWIIHYHDLIWEKLAPALQDDLETITWLKTIIENFKVHHTDS